MKRNRLHKSIVSKYGIERRLVFETDNEKEAFTKEIEIIALRKTWVHGGDGFWGANFTLGGDGVVGHSGWHHSELAKIAIGKGNSGKVRTPEMRKITSETTCAAMTEDVKEKISKAGLGRIQSDETKERRAIKIRGVGNGNYGKYGYEHPAGSKTMRYCSLDAFGEIICRYRSFSEMQRAGFSRARVCRAIQNNVEYKSVRWVKLDQFGNPTLNPNVEI